MTPDRLDALTRRERLLRESMDLVLLAFSDKAAPTDATLLLSKSNALWRTAMSCAQVTDGGDRGATDRWFADIEEWAGLALKAKPPARKVS